MSTHKQDWSNYWQGRNSDEALAGVGIEQDKGLVDFWVACFEALPAEAKLLDMACGAGSVLRRADAVGVKDLTGVDISADAIETMIKNLPNAQGVVSAVDKTPLEDGTFDMVVSQFGFEYAGEAEQVLATAREMARLVGLDGRFAAICHIEGGGIDAEVAGHLAHIKQIEEAGFIGVSKAIFVAADTFDAQPSAENKQAYEKAVALMSGPRDLLVDWITTHQNSAGQIAELAQHLYNGTLQMFNRRKAFALNDITGWFDGMDAEIQAYKGRMSSMQSAALSETEAQGILEVFAKAGFTVEALDKLYLRGDDKPTAWILKATRSA